MPLPTCFETPRVIVAHPGAQYSYETALAVQSTGLLQYYVTSLYAPPNSHLRRCVQWLPTALRRSIEPGLAQRSQDGLDAKRVKTYPTPELAYLAACRICAFQRYAPTLLRWRNEWIDRVVSRLVARDQPQALICYDTSALKAFRRAKALGIWCILDQSIGHLKTGLRILAEEAALHPDFADSLSLAVPDWLVDRCTEEALLADRVLAASNYVKGSLMENGVAAERIVRLPYGADTERFRPATQGEKRPFRLIFVGHLSQRKGIKYLLEAVKQLRLPQLELLLIGGVVGSGDGLAPYREYFLHVSQVPYDQVHTYFQRGDVFVFPSLHEGSARVIYEALACGLPVITTPNSGSVVRDGIDGFIVAIRDVEALQEKIELLYTDTALREEMGHNARKRAEAFSWQAYRQRLGAFLHELLTETPPGLA